MAVEDVIRSKTTSSCFKLLACVIIACPIRIAATAGPRMCRSMCTFLIADTVCTGRGATHACVKSK